MPKPRRRNITTLTHRDEACFGPRQLKVPGSIEWCYQTLEVLKARWARREMVEHQWTEALEELTEYKVWERFPPEKPYGSIDKMLMAELGVNGKTALTRIRVQAAAKNTDGQVLPNDGSVNQHQVPEGGYNIPPREQRALQNGVSRGTQRLLDILAKDFPHLHEQVANGEMGVKTAAKEAGIYRDSAKPATVVNRILKDYSEDEIKELMEQLQKRS